jgi:hypothetical protein
VPGHWTAAAYTCLMVALYVAEPAVVSLTVHDHVQLDRLTGTSAERHDDLLPPGTTSVRLAAGTYVFRTTADAQVQLGEGAKVHVLAATQVNGKDDPPEHMMAQALPTAMGDSPPDHVPTLTVLGLSPMPRPVDAKVILACNAVDYRTISTSRTHAL